MYVTIVQVHHDSHRYERDFWRIIFLCYTFLSSYFFNLGAVVKDIASVHVRIRFQFKNNIDLIMRCKNTSIQAKILVCAVRT